MAVTAALVTPVIGATATSVVTASFSPVVGTLLVAFGCARQAAAAIPTISDSLGGTWTAIPSSGIDSTVVAAQMWTHVVTVSTARTVTVVSTGATQVAVGIVAVTGGKNNNFSNFASNINAAGDPSLTLSAFQTNSIGLGFLVSNAGAAASTPPSGYAELNDSVPATNLKTSIVYDATAPGTTLAWVSTGTDSIGYGLEIREYTPPLADAWNSDDMSASLTLSNSDKTATTSVAGGARSTQTYVNGTAGKYYSEIVLSITATTRPGITPLSNTLIATTANFHVIASSGFIIINNVNTGITLSAFVANDICCIAWDAGAERVWFRKNGGLWNNDAAADPATGTNGLDCSFAASSAHALWIYFSSITGNATIRTELAEFTQAVPSGFLSWMGESSGPTAYTLPAVAGSYALTGATADLEKSHLVTAVAGAYALTGAAATLTKGVAPVAYNLPADAGSYALTGQTVSLELGKELLALAGSYGLSGATAALERGREVLAVAGSHALSGQAASLEYGREVLALGGTYALTGTAAAFRRTWKTTAVSGSYTLTGVPANLLTVGAYAVIGLPGAYALTGATANLEYGREVSAIGGSYALSGQVASLEKGREVLAVAGSYALTGQPSTLSKTGAGIVLIAEAGSYALTGSPVTLVWSGEIVVTPPGGGGMPWYGRPSGGKVPSKQLRKAVRELIARQERRKKPKKAKELARELVAKAIPAAGGLGILEKKAAVALIAEGLRELWPIYFASETIHDKRAFENAVLYLLVQAIQRIHDEEEDEEAALLLMSAA